MPTMTPYARGLRVLYISPSASKSEQAAWDDGFSAFSDLREAIDDYEACLSGTPETRSNLAAAVDRIWNRIKAEGEL